MMNTNTYTDEMGDDFCDEDIDAHSGPSMDDADVRQIFDRMADEAASYEAEAEAEREEEGSRNRSSRRERDHGTCGGGSCDVSSWNDSDNCASDQRYRDW